MRADREVGIAGENQYSGKLTSALYHARVAGPTQEQCDQSTSADAGREAAAAPTVSCTNRIFSMAGADRTKG
jgi:hypothetical protein